MPVCSQWCKLTSRKITIIQCLDSVVVTRPSLYLSSLLLCVRGMLHLPYPIGMTDQVHILWRLLLTAQVNVLTKIDNLKAVGGDDLPFNLDFYTEVQDLTYLLPALAMEQGGMTTNAKFDKLNDALIQLVEDFGLVGFETLAVEDRASMASFLRAIDRASGWVFAGARATDETGRTLDDEASIWAQAMSDHWAGKMEVRDVQERWIDRREEYDKLEKQAWEEEAKMATETPSSAAVERAAEKATASGGVSTGDAEEDEMLAEQQKWQEQQRKQGRSGGGTKVERTV